MSEAIAERSGRAPQGIYASLSIFLAERRDLTAGTVRIIALLLADVELRHPESFAVIDDAETS